MIEAPPEPAPATSRPAPATRRPAPRPDLRTRNSAIPPGLRPSAARAAAAARLAGVAAVSGGWSGAATTPSADDRRPHTSGRPSISSASSQASGGPANIANRLLHGARAAGVATAVGVATAAALAERAMPWTRPDAPVEGRPRHLRVVEPRPALSPAQRRRRARAVLIACVGLGTMVALALVYLHVILAQRQFQLDQMNSTVQKDQTAYQNLRLQVAGLGSPQHIISTAIGQLGMVQPGKVTYLKSAPGSPDPSPNSGLGSPPSSTQAPAGDADWPMIKSQLAGTP
jgi:cell division protein FtsL